MNKPRLPDDGVAQAVYTWSRKLVYGSQGMGFAEISPSLVGSIDWLKRIDPAEFSLFQGDVTGASTELYEARKGFSEIGRMIVDDIAIVYRKTADGLVTKKSGRAHQVVHALIGEPATLEFSYMTRIRDDFWMRKVGGSGGGPPLTDLILADVLEETDDLDEQTASGGHTCPGDHGGAENVLRAIVKGRFEREGTLLLGSGDEMLSAVALAFPDDVANGFSLVPYVAIDGVRRELLLRLPGAEGPGTARPGECSFEAAVRQAGQFLFGAKPSLSRYAEAALNRGKPSIGGTVPPEGGSVRWEHPTPKSEINPVYALLDEVHEGPSPLSNPESKVLLGKLVVSGLGPERVLALPHTTLVRMFAGVGNADVLLQWSRQLFADVGAEVFIDLWNKTKVGAFLGIALIKNPIGTETKGPKVFSEKGVTPEVTAAILRSMRRHEHAGQRIGWIIEHGFGDTLSMREFIAETFKDDPRYLFDAILVYADISPSDLADFIRSCYDAWADHRRLPERESAAILHELRLTLLQRLKVLIGR